ncbi:MAG: hypothetical protein ACRCZ9_00775 [Fusobacteriaceae bacterium]
MRILEQIKNFFSYKKDIDVTIITVLSFAISFLISFKFYKNNIFGINDKYKEFIIGDTIYSAYTKDVDVKVIFMFMTIFLIFYFLASKIYKIKYWQKIKIEKNEYKFLILIGLPFIKYFANPILKQFDYNYLYGYLTYIYLIFMWIYKEKYEKIIKIINIILFSYLSSEVLKYIFVSYINYNISSKYIFAILLSISLILYKNIGLLLSQIFLPFYFLKLIENHYLYRGELITIQKSINSKILAVILIILSLVYSIYEFKQKKSKILLSTLFIVTMILYWQNIGMFYVYDEYHFGELYTAYDQLYTQGNKLYSEYIPVKGYFHIIIGWINQIFYGGYTGLQKASVLTEYLSKILLVAILNTFMLKELMLLFIFLNVLPTSGNYFLIIPILAFLCQEKIINKNWNFVIGYLYLNFVYFMYYQSFGIALALCLAPNLIYSLYKIFKNKEKPTKNINIFLIGGIALLLYTLKSIYYGLKYSLINASSNLYYWGNSSGYNGQNKNSFFIEMITKNIWVGVSILLLIYLIKNFKSIQIKEKIIYFTVIFYPIIINSYLLGRHDGWLGRTYQFSIVTIQFLLILFVYLFENLKKKNVLIMFLISVLINYNLDKRGVFNFKNFKISPVKVIHNIPTDLERGINSELKKIGEGFISKAALDDLQMEYNLIMDVTEKKEESTFLIIDGYVSQSARYSLFNKKIPTLSHSVLNIPSLKSQEMELKRFEKFDVPIIRVSSGISRYLLFYKNILQKDYIYTHFNGREYLIKKESFEKIKNKYSLENIPLPGYLYQKEFGILPIKWGNGYKNNKENLKKLENNLIYIGVNQLEVENKGFKILNSSDPFIIYNLSNKINGEDSDFIKMNLKTDFKNNFRMQIFWANENGSFEEKKSVFLTAKNGNIVVPLVLNLDWLKDKNIDKIRIDFIDLPIETKINIDKIEFLKYKN